MNDDSRGMVGVVRPTRRGDDYEELRAMLPNGIRLLTDALDVRRGGLDEFEAAIPAYEEKIAEFARTGIKVINPAGAPPFMVLGYAKEQDTIRRWEDTYKARIFTSCTTHVDAFRALNIKRFVGATYFRGDINRIFAQYFVDAGFDCLAIAGMDVDFPKVPQLRSEDVYRFIKDEFAKHKNVEAVYMLGSAWKTVDIIERMEREFGVPVVHAVPAHCWDIQRHLGMREPVKGYGRLLAEMPMGVTMATHKVASR